MKKNKLFKKWSYFAYILVLVAGGLTAAIAASSSLTQQTSRSGLSSQLVVHRQSDATTSEIPASESTSTSSSSSLSPGTFYYRPLSMTLNSNASEWNTSLYPSQVTESNIRQMLVFNSESTSSTTTATEDLSGYQLEKETSQTNGTKIFNKINADSLSTALGTVPNTSLSSSVIEITDADDSVGTLFFKVYQPLNTYTVTNNSLVQNNNKTAATDIRALILPPTKYASSTDNTTWKIPFDLKKVRYVFKWADQSLIRAFIRRNANVLPSSIPASDFFSSLISITPDFVKANKLPPLEMKQINVNSTDLPGYVVQTNDDLGTVRITVRLGDGIFTANGDVQRSFFGFRSSVSDQKQVKLNLANPTLLINSSIALGLWDSYRSPGTETLVGKRVSDLLPSQFLNPVGASFLDVFNGKKVTVGTNTKEALDIIQNNGSTGHTMGTLTYLNSRPNTNGLPNFQITKIQGIPNDKTGQLSLLITYQSFDDDGNLFETTPFVWTIDGFSKNDDSGQNLFFMWRNSLPYEFISQSSEDIVAQFTRYATDSDIEGFSASLDAKRMVQSMFEASNYMLNKFNSSVTNNLGEVQNVRVSLSLVEANANPGGSKNADNILVKIKWPRLNGSNDVVYSSIFSPTSNLNFLPQDERASINPNPTYLQTNNPYAELFPSQISLEQIKEMFQLHVPQSGLTQTSAYNDVIFFYIPDDQNGKLTVTLIFPLFNGQPNYQFSQTFLNFKKNQIYDNNLELKSTPISSLSQNFLALNPMDPNDVNAQTVYENLFKNLNSTIRNSLFPLSAITVQKRTTDSIQLVIKVNWTQWIEHFISISSSSNQASNKNLGQKIHHSDMVDNSTNNNDDQTLTYNITGFTGYTGNWNFSNQTKKLEQAILSDQQIAIIAGTISGGLFLIALIASTRLFYHYQKYKKLDPEN